MHDWANTTLDGSVFLLENVAPPEQIDSLSDYGHKIAMKSSLYIVCALFCLDYWAMRTLHAICDIGAGPNLIRSGILPLGWRCNLFISAHLHRLGDAKGRLLQLLGMVVIRLRLGDSHFRVPFILSKHLAESMIIGTEFLERHFLAIRCMAGIVETTWGTVCILGRNNSTIYAAETDVEQPKPSSEHHPDPDIEAFPRRYIRSLKTVRVPPMTQVPVLVRFQLHRVVHNDQNQTIFVNHILKLTNNIDEIDPDKPLIVVAANL